MEKLQKQMEAFLAEVRHTTESDYSAFGLVNQKEHLIRLKYVSGSRNDRYKQITLPLGKGIAGQVVRTGRPFAVDRFVPKSGDYAREYSIFLAEGLKSMLGVPVLVKQQAVGVLLVGCRRFQHFAGDTVQTVSDMAEQLSGILLRLAYDYQTERQQIYHTNEADYRENGHM